ncbi:MAG: hypothetical protein ABI947_22335 [Chloroflexota bacterium]
MKQLLSLLEAYLSNKTTIDDFEHEFLDLWREVRDKRYQIIREHPDLEQAADELLKQRLNGTLSDEEYNRMYYALNKRYYANEVMILPGSFEDKIMNDLFSVVEAYSPEHLRGPYELTEVEVLQAAQQAYEQLKAVRM